MHLTVYGDFNCPFSALASERAARLEATASADIEWRAVQHLPDLPADGLPIDGDLARQVGDELDQVRSMLRDAETFPIRIPPVRPNTTLASRALASVSRGQRSRLRSRLFHAYWLEALDIGDRDVLDDLGIPTPTGHPPVVRTWQAEWRALDNRMVPMMRLPDGYLSKGLGVLSRLSDLLDGRHQRPDHHGG